MNSSESNISHNMSSLKTRTVFVKEDFETGSEKKASEAEINGVIILYTSSYSILHGKYLYVGFKDNLLYMFTDRFICYYVFSYVLFVVCFKNNYK